MSLFGYRQPSDLPATLPLFAVEGAVLYPRATLAINIFEPRYLNMVDDALAGERLIGVIQPRSGEKDEPNPDLAGVGAAGRITSFAETADGRYLVELTGICRFAVGAELEANLPYRQALVDYAPFANDFQPDSGRGVDRAQLMRSLKTYAALHGYDVDWDSVEHASVETIVNVASQICPFESAAKQALLEAPTLTERSAALIALLEWDNAADEQRPGSVQ